MCVSLFARAVCASLVPRAGFARNIKNIQRGVAIDAVRLKGTDMVGKRLLAVTVAIVALAVAASRADATTIAWETIVRVDSVAMAGRVPANFAAVQVGDNLEWSVYIDPSGPSIVIDTNPGSIGRYDVIRSWLIEFPLGPLRLDIPEPSSPAAGGGIDVHDELNGFDEINVQANARVGSNDTTFDTFHAGMFFLDLTATAIDSADLPLNPPDLAAFASHTFTLEFQENDLNRPGFWRAQGEIVAIRRVLAVPEPASLWLMLTGMLSIPGVMKLPRRRAPP